jgi:hypothetical protein
MKVIYTILIILAVLVLIGWIGLQVKPKPFSKPSLTEGEKRTIALPSGLPKPVERFYRATYGEQIPVIETVILIGRGRMRPFGI